MANPSVLEGTPRKNPQSPTEKGAECEYIDISMRHAQYHKNLIQQVTRCQFVDDVVIGEEVHDDAPT